MPRRPDACVYYLTVKKDQQLNEAIQEHLGGTLMAHRVIPSGGIWHQNKRLTNSHKWLKKGDELKVYQSPTQGYGYLFSDELIVSENNDWMVVIKEPLIPTGMDRSNMHFNLMAGINRYLGNLDMTKGVQPITRLDYRVGGLCLFSKNKEAERRLFKQMQQRRVKKRYLAFVPKEEPVIKRVMVENHLIFTNKARVAANGKYSKTIFILKKSHLNGHHVYYALAKTGRRHQVRVHAKQAIGALIQDERYGSGLDRHAPIGLVASHLRFTWKRKPINIHLPLKWEAQFFEWLSKKSENR